MKPLAPYFGNRFATVAKKKAIKSATKIKASSEMEALESRLLLSGVGTGFNKKSVSFFDADGDKVSVKLQGQGTFNINLLGGNSNNSDIANITINGALDKKTGNLSAGSLGVTVAPIGSFTKPVTTKPILNPNFDIQDLFSTSKGGDSLTINGVKNWNQQIQNQYFNLTPGYTNIGSITATAPTTVGATVTIGNIGLNAAVVPVIDLTFRDSAGVITGGATVGSIGFSTGMVAKVDQFMANNDAYFATYGEWNPGLANIQVWDISAGSIAGINLAGINPETYSEANGTFAGNNFLGDIVATTGGIGRISGTQSSFDGSISLLGQNSFLGNVVLGGGFTNGSVINAAGNLTFNAADFSGALNVGGHLNLGLRGGGFDGTIIAGNGISGINASTTDGILVSGASVAGQIIATKGNIAAITLTNSSLNAASVVAELGNIGNILVGEGSTMSNSTIEAANIGIISVRNAAGLGLGNSIIASGDLAGIVVRNADLTNTNTFSVGGEIGLIDISNGDLAANLSAGSFGDIVLRGGGINSADLSGKIQATNGSVDSISITFGNLSGLVSASKDITAIEITGGALSGTVTAGNDIGTIEANGSAFVIADTAIIAATGDITSIKATSFSNSAIGAAHINAGGTLGSLTGTALNAGDGIIGTHVVAGTITSIKGESVAGSGLVNAVLSSTVGGISSIVGTGYGNGISNIQASAATAITSVTGSATVGTGILQSRLVASTIGNIAGTSAFGIGINDLSVTATGAATLGNITGTGETGGVYNLTATSASSIGNITGVAKGSGSGIDVANLVAATSVGSITGTSFSTSAGDSGMEQVTVSAGTTIGAISGIGYGASGVTDSTFVTQTGDITSVYGESKDSNGFGSGISGTSIISMAGMVSNIEGKAQGSGYGILNTTISAQQNVNNVTGTSLFGTGIGEVAGASLIYSATGNIGAVSGSSLNATGTGDGINGLEVRAELGSIASITGLASGLVSGSGLVGLDVFAAKSALSITGSANAGDGINGGTYLLASGDLTINANTIAGTAIGGNADFEASLGTVTLNVTATGETAAGINGASFTGASIAPISITIPSSQGGTAINNADFTATSGDIGDITIISNSTAGGSGIAGDSNFLAVSGNIGDIVVTMNGIGAGTAIDSSSFQAAGNIDSVTVISTSTGINAGTFTADREGNLVGAIIGDISVTVTGEKASGITGASAFSGASLSDITVNASTSLTDSAISGSTFTATAGNIGKISATANGAEASDNAITASTFQATGEVGAISATALAGTALNNVQVTADSDLSGAGNIVSITALSSTGSAIVDSAKNTFTGAGIGDIVAKVTANGNDAIDGADFNARTTNIGNITATTAGIANTDDAITGATFTAEVNVGNILTTASAGSAISGGSITASTGSIGTIDATAGNVGLNSTVTADQNIGIITATVNKATGGSAIAGSITATNGIIGTIGVDSIIVNSIATAGDAFTGTVNAGTGIGNITVQADTTGAALSANINSDTLNIWTLETAKPTNYGQLGSITVTNTGAGDGITSLTVTAAKIGNIQVILSDTGAGDAINGTTFTAATNTEAVLGTGVYNNFGEIGNISISNATQDGSGNGITDAEFFAGGAGSIGNIEVLMTGIDGVFVGDGIDTTTFDAANNTGTDSELDSTIGSVTVTHTGDGDAIDTATFNSNKGVGLFNITAQGTGLRSVNINSDVDGDLVGSIGTVTVSVTGLGGDGIVNGTWTGESIGDISVDFTRADGNNGIVSLSATSTDGDIGAITVGKTNAAAGVGIDSVTFDSSNDIGAITVTSNGVALGDALGVNPTTITAGNDIGAITLTSNKSSALSFANGASVITVGNDLTSFTAKSLSTTAVIDAVQATAKNDVALAVGNDVLGNILITNSGTSAAADGMALVKFDITGSVLGTTTVTAVGGVAMNNASIDPVNMNTIVLTGGVQAGVQQAAMSNSEIITTGDVVSLTITGSVDSSSVISVGNISKDSTITGDLAGALSSTTNIANITITGVLSGSITAGDTLVNGGGDIGNITADSISGSITAQSKDATDSIGTVTATNGITGGSITTGGTLDSIQVTTSGGAALNVTAGSITNASSFVGNVSGTITTTIGDIDNITVLADAVSKVPTDGNLSAAIVSETNIGNISVAGALTGNITAGDILVNGGGDIGTVKANTINNDILAQSKDATDSIGTVTATNGIFGGSITTGGTLDSIQVTTSGGAVLNVTAASITNASSFVGNVSGTITTTIGDIDNITVLVDAVSKVPTNGDLSANIISETNIGNISVAGALTGNITAGDILVNGGGDIGTVKANTINNDILAQSKDATDSIGTVTATNGILGGSITTGGTLDSIQVTTSGGAALTVSAGSITNASSIVGNVSGSITTNVGAIGKITVLADTVNITDGDLAATITSETNIGNISVAGALTGNITAGDAAVNGGGVIGTITADTINNIILAQSKDDTDSIGTVTAANGILGGSITTGGALDSIQVTTSGGAALNVTAASITNASSIVGNVSGSITTNVGAVGNLTVTTGDISAFTIASATNIGDITGTGSGDSTFTLNTGVAGTIGKIDFDSGDLANSKTVDITITDAATIGNILVGSTAGSANLAINGGAALTSVGAIQVDGELDVTGATLTKVATLTSLTAGSMALSGGVQRVIGDSAAAGTSVGSISITTDMASIAAGVTLADSQYRFNFDSYTATPDGVVGASNMTAATTGGWTFQTPGSGNSTLGGISFILA